VSGIIVADQSSSKYKSMSQVNSVIISNNNLSQVLVKLSWGAGQEADSIIYTSTLGYFDLTDLGIPDGVMVHVNVSDERASAHFSVQHASWSGDFAQATLGHNMDLVLEIVPARLQKNELPQAHVPVSRS
jgi:hypothetical protein